jgi:hypothetical protein
MNWEYLVLAVILGWAVYRLWCTFVQKKGCSCGSCPAAGKSCCSPESIALQGMEETHKVKDKEDM